MHSHLLRWLELYEKLLGRKLLPEDHIFPHLSTNGIIHPHKEMSYDIFMKLFTSFTSSAGLDGWFTTHSFRRGGAQYRFIFAPPSYHWLLNVVRWWGGWAEGENVCICHFTRTYVYPGLQVDTLMKYLLDSLQSYENGHGDALQPVPSGFSESFIGERIEEAPVTAREVRELKRSVDEKFESIDRSLDQKMDEVIDVVTRITSEFTGTQTCRSGIRNPPECRAERSVHAGRLGWMPYPPRAVSVASSSSDVPNEAASLAGPLSMRVQSEKGHRVAPIQGVNIPNLRAGPDAWRDAIKQWEEGDPATGLVALKDWSEAWYRGTMRTFTASKRHERELIVIAYNL